MKKLFFYAAAAVAMLAGCQKSEISGTPAVDDSVPAAIQFGINAPSLTVAQTKAAVTEWNNSEVYVYGLKQEGRVGTTVTALGQGMYDLSNAYIKDYKTTAVSGVKSALEVYDDETNKVPYFYAEGETYDFFGYHLGGAEKGDVDSLTTVDQVTVAVKIDGSQDVMVAYADKTEDIKANATQPMGTDDVYSAWAARRGVQPTLKFQHALSRFNIIVRGMNSLSEKVTIMGVTAAAQETGNLIVVGANDELGYTGTGSNVDLALKNQDNSTYTNDKVVWGNTNPAGGANACFMLAPGLDKVEFTVVSINNEHNTPLADQKVVAEAVKLVKSGHGLLPEGERQPAEATVFEAGKAYNIYINVYGPEEIKITAELTEWQEGGDFVYDPDIRPGAGNSDITPEKTLVVADTLNMGVNMTEAEWNTLPAAVLAANPVFAEAKQSFPWVGVSLLDENGVKAPAGTYTVQVLYKGDAVDLNLESDEFPFQSYDAVSKKLTFTMNSEVSWIGFEVVRNLAGSPDADLKMYEIVVLYENVVTGIVNEAPAALGSSATAEDYAAQLPAWYVEKYSYEASKTSFPWVGVTFEPVKAGTPIKIEVLNNGTPVVLDPAKITWSGLTFADDCKSMTVVRQSNLSYAGFEVVRELGLTEADLANLAVKVTVE